jgi:APA family basic amino acid/polyamine antiporter
MPKVEELGIVEKFIHFICVKARTDPFLVGWPIPEHQSLLQSPGGSVLWNGISIGVCARAIRTD